MYTIFNKLGVKSFMAHELGTFILGWIIAETFYKFGSFTLETGAFLLTWWSLGFLAHRIIRKKGKYFRYWRTAK